MRRALAVGLGCCVLLGAPFAARSQQYPIHRSNSGNVERKGETGTWKENVTVYADHTERERIESDRYTDKPDHWASSHFIEYFARSKHPSDTLVLLKGAWSWEEHNGVYSDKKYTLEWTDADGTFSTEECQQSIHASSDIVIHHIDRKDAERKQISGFNLETETGKDTQRRVYSPEKGEWVKDDNATDATECKNDLFPLGLLKNKPPVFP